MMHTTATKEDRNSALLTARESECGAHPIVAPFPLDISVLMSKMVHMMNLDHELTEPLAVVELNRLGEVEIGHTGNTLDRVLENTRDDSRHYFCILKDMPRRIKVREQWTDAYIEITWICRLRSGTGVPIHFFIDVVIS